MSPVTELLIYIWILNLDHITGPISIIPCFPQVVVFILGIIKLPEFLRLKLRLLKEGLNGVVAFTVIG